ncbi:MAG: serine hydrolase [Bryobacterales bacterium]|nr:serine hydrolase [Bryobacterales bacterium]
MFPTIISQPGVLRWRGMTRRDLLIAAPAVMRAQGAGWRTGDPAALGLDGALLRDLGAALGGRGCVVRDGVVASTWGAQNEHADVFSSAKPLLSTLLFLAVEEGRLAGVDAAIGPYWPQLAPKDRSISFAHLANMMSGYARPEPPGTAWAYNDYAIQLYQQTLFDRVFRQTPETAAHVRLAALGLEDGLRFRERNRRLSATVRDFARIAWMWLEKGAWNGRQIVPRAYFERYQQPRVPFDLPHTAAAETDDYLGIGTFGGGSDHFTQFGAGAYGFNWWFNRKGRLHPDRTLWPDAPADTFLSIGAFGNNAVMIPSLRLVLVSSQGEWGALEGGAPAAPMNRHIARLAASVKR